MWFLRCWKLSRLLTIKLVGFFGLSRLVREFMIHWQKSYFLPYRRFIYFPFIIVSLYMKYCRRISNHSIIFLLFFHFSYICLCYLEWLHGFTKVTYKSFSTKKGNKRSRKMKNTAGTHVVLTSFLTAHITSRRHMDVKTT